MQRGSWQESGGGFLCLKNNDMESIYIGLAAMFSMIGFGIFFYLLCLGMAKWENNSEKTKEDD